MAKIGFIGMGNMGYAILKGLLAYIPKEEVTFSEVNRERRLWAEEQTGVCAAESGKDCAEKSKYLILAVKPQYMDQVMEQLAPVIKKEQIIISIAAGIDTRYLKGKLGEDKRIVRSMPNTPALVGEGMSGVCMEESQFTEEEKLEIGKIFNSFGKMKIVPEKLIDAVGCVSGCSPAYVYMFIEALADGAVKYGLPRKDAYEMAAQAVFGSAKMVLETGMHPGELKDMVCSPGGTTIEGVSALEECGFRSAIIKACDASYLKNSRLK